MLGENSWKIEIELFRSALFHMKTRDLLNILSMVVSGHSFFAHNSSQAPSNFDNFVNFKAFNKVLI